MFLRCLRRGSLLAHRVRDTVRLFEETRPAFTGPDLSPGVVQQRV